MGAETVQAIMPKLRTQTEQLSQKFQSQIEEIKKKYETSSTQ